MSDKCISKTHIQQKQWVQLKLRAKSNISVTNCMPPIYLTQGIETVRFLDYFWMMPNLFAGCSTLARLGRYVMLCITLLERSFHEH